MAAADAAAPRSSAASSRGLAGARQLQEARTAIDQYEAASRELGARERRAQAATDDPGRILADLQARLIAVGNGSALVPLPPRRGRKPRRDSTNTAWQQPGFRGYADYLETARHRDAIDARLVKLLSARARLALR